MVGTRTLTHGQRWAIAFLTGWGSWFLAICIMRMLPPLLQFIFIGIPIGAFAYAAYELPRWRKQGRRQDLTDSLKEREFDHGVLQQHELTMGAMDWDYQSQQHAMMELMGIPTPQTLPEVTLERRVADVAGEMGLALLYYIQGRGSTLADAQGWVKVESVRSNWGKHYNLKTDEIRNLLSSLGAIGVGEFKDSARKEWRCIGI